MNKKVRAAVFARAEGVCECGCGKSLDNAPEATGELDHFFGRDSETVETCWALRRDHHREKTDGFPSAGYWCLLFLAHCRRHRLFDAAEQAQKKLEWHAAKKAVGA